MTQVFLLEGRVINVGPWDYQIEVLTDHVLVDGTEDEYEVVKVGEVVRNPMPPGTIETTATLTADARGCIVLAHDYELLRKAEYPPIGDQLDALWKGGEDLLAMSETIQSVKDKYPKLEVT